MPVEGERHALRDDEAHETPDGCAPSAIRMPISRARCGHGVAQHAVHANRGQDERHGGQQSEHEHRKAALGDRARHGLGERLEAEDGERGVLFANHAAHAGDERLGIAGRPHQEHAAAIGGRRLIERRVDGDRRRLRQPLKPLVADDADDRASSHPRS